VTGSTLDLENAASAGASRSLSELVLSASALAFALLGVPPIVFPGLTLEHLGWPRTSFGELVLSLIALTFWLLALSFVRARQTKDRLVLEGFARAVALFGGLWLYLGVALAGARPWGFLAGAGLVTLVGLGAQFALARERMRRAAPRPRSEGWALHAPLAAGALLTAAAGTLLVLLAGWVARALGAEGPTATMWVAAYGLCFWVGTLAMWPCRYSRDPWVAKGQIEGSLVFDSVTALLLVLAVVEHRLGRAGLVLALPFALTAVWGPVLWLKADALQRADIRRPATLMALQELIVEASRAGLLVRVQGAGYSARPSSFAQGTPRPVPARPSESQALDVSLEHLDQVVHVDSAHRRISVQAGMHIGQNPHVPSSLDNNLLLHVTARGWSLPALGTITHQSVGGFIATGSAGGSRRHSLADSIVELRFLDASGQLQVANREADADLFYATLVSLGLLGVLVEITFECEPSEYYVKGRELAGEVVGKRWRLPTLDALPAERRASEHELIELTSSGPDGLAAYLKRIEYGRILWWPQKDPTRESSFRGWMVAWEGQRSLDAPEKPQRYEAERSLKRNLAGTVLWLVRQSHLRGPLGALGRYARRFLPSAIQLLVPIAAPRLFDERWDRNLPLDNDADDWVIASDLSELWFPMSQTHRVMARLLELYEDDVVGGTFACQLYTSRPSAGWLSPAYGEEDMFRVDVLWFGRGAVDPRRAYFPRFWRALAPLGFRAHWGKHLPEPHSSEGVAYARPHYPRWDDFLRLREMYDPRDTFLSRYWRRHLDVQ
jgi:D-arabinono-1,4-lactone oxidase/FAD binding domain-containing protein